MSRYYLPADSSSYGSGSGSRSYASGSGSGSASGSRSYVPANNYSSGAGLGADLGSSSRTRSGSSSRTRSGSSSRTRSRSRSRSSGSSQPPPEIRRDVLPNMRVFDQSRPDPFHVQHLSPSSRTFRFVVFVMHFAISLLESTKGRSVLIDTGISVWEGYGSRERRRMAFRGNGDRAHDRALMVDTVDDFLSNIRTDPPNVIVSTRVSGEGVAQRLDWWNGENKFQVKWGAIYRLNKTIIDNAIRVADATDPDVEEFQRFLFLMGMAAAHELVHAFVGVLTGSAETLTPAAADYPRPGIRGSVVGGESGRYFEGAFCGFLVEAYHRDGHRMGVRQAGELIARTSDINLRAAFYRLDRNWVLDRLRLDFRSSSLPARVVSWDRLRQKPRVSMEEIRGRSTDADFDDDLTEFIETINRLPVHRVGSEELSHIMAMVTRPQNIRSPLVSAGLAY